MECIRIGCNNQRTRSFDGLCIWHFYAELEALEKLRNERLKAE